MNPMQAPNVGPGGKDFGGKEKNKKKKKYIHCPKCHSKDVRPEGRAFGNWGKKEFRCGSCGNYWQYGY